MLGSLKILSIRKSASNGAHTSRPQTLKSHKRVFSPWPMKRTNINKFYGSRMNLCGYLTVRTWTYPKGKRVIFCILTWFTNCAISLRYESISAVTKVTTLCVNALVRTSAIFVFALVNICVEWIKKKEREVNVPSSINRCYDSTRLVSL